MQNIKEGIKWLVIRRVVVPVVLGLAGVLLDAGLLQGAALHAIADVLQLVADTLREAAGDASRLLN